MPPLPNSNASPYPSYPNQSNASMPPSSSSYPRQSMQPQMPQMPFGAGFMPSATPNAPYLAYPTQPSSTTVYPPAMPNVTQNPYSNILPSQHQGYSGYGFQQVPSANTGSSYPIVNNMAPCFSQMQGHIKDVRRSKVCF